jgi:hypothetical protein
VVLEVLVFWPVEEEAANPELSVEEVAAKDFLPLDLTKDHQTENIPKVVDQRNLDLTMIDQLVERESHTNTREETLMMRTEKVVSKDLTEDVVVPSEEHQEEDSTKEVTEVVTKVVTEVATKVLQEVGMKVDTEGVTKVPQEVATKVLQEAATKVVQEAAMKVVTEEDMRAEVASEEASKVEEVVPRVSPE